MREANTLGSKSAALELTSIAVEMKVRSSRCASRCRTSSSDRPDTDGKAPGAKRQPGFGAPEARPSTPCQASCPLTPWALPPPCCAPRPSAATLEPTPIQAAAIPAVLAGRDVLGLGADRLRQDRRFRAAAAAATAQGRLAPSTRTRPATRALVLVPTRELAAQVGEVFRLPGAPPRAAAQGGHGLRRRLDQSADDGLRGGADIVVATPGRLLDLVDHNALRLDGRCKRWCSTKPTACWTSALPTNSQRVLALLPARRQNLLFSATFPPAVQALADALLHDPVRIDVRVRRRPEPADRAARDRRSMRRAAPQLLRHLVQQDGWRACWCSSPPSYATELVADKLRRRGIAAAALHGELSQGARTQALAAFKARQRAGRAGRDRSGGARHRHRRAAGGRQLRPAALGGGLRAPHRPHRSRRRRAGWR